MNCDHHQTWSYSYHPVKDQERKSEEERKIS